MRQLKITKQITNRETESLNKYLQDVSKLDMITADEEVELAQRIKKGDQVALDKMVKANLRFVVSVAKQYQNRGLRLTDLINEGNIGLVKAAKRFDETRGFKFISYAVWWIRQSILQAIAEKSKIIRLPLNKIGTINKINGAFAQLEQELQRKPTPREIADRIDISVRQVKSCLKHNQRSVSMDAPLSEDSKSDRYHLIKSEKSPNPEAPLMHESLKTQLDQTLKALPDKDATILKLHYGLNGQRAMSLTEIGDLFELSRERVRQIREKALKKLQRKDYAKTLIPYLAT